MDNAVSIIQQLGRNTQLIKLDIKDAYRIVPVHPADYHLLGVRWEDQTYVDRSLPFGLRSAPKIFTAIADFIAWVLHCLGVQHQLHYLDDYLFLAIHGGENLRDAILQIFHLVGIPVAVHKTEGPATALAFLGILIDTHTFELRLPADKLAHLQELIQSWVGRKHCTRRDLESLLGYLSHAATVINQGRTFLRQLFFLLARDRAPYHRIHLDLGARADLLWWKVFLQDWNGSSFFPPTTPALEVVSDASGSYGCGAFSLPHGWFQVQWPEDWAATHIAPKEMVPLVVAAALWGYKWKRSRICFKTDNMAVVAVLRNRTSRDHLLMHLLRCLAFYLAYFKFEFVAEHVPGALNTATDAITSLYFCLLFHRSRTLPSHSRSWICWYSRGQTGAPEIGQNCSHSP